ncbi:LADA_0D07096g1_1 [Lachancea dasiensis]|uniref:LADA_0D07096g1_1 n=1 Tax=Lachancea dasiensis TaxID=1072105 RepID=A0A1G4J686_9SACH|nr:LADA_0D07096g1_1 [Lachancea dasiensis]
MSQSEKRSLADLPLDVLMDILFFLPFQDLENVGKTCRTLRILSNESVTYRRTLTAPNDANRWTRRLLMDFLQVVNEKRQLLEYIDAKEISIVAAVSEVQMRFELGSQVPLLTYQHGRALQDLSEANQRANADSTAKGSSAKDDLAKDDSLVYPRTQSSSTLPKSSAHHDREGLAYLKILQGFHRIATNSHKLLKKRHGRKVGTPSSPLSSSSLALSQNGGRPHTPNKKGHLNVALTPIEFQNYASSARSTSETEKGDSGSPDSLQRSRSPSSIFSDVPKLSDLSWSYSDDLKDLEANNTDSGSDNSTDSSSSVKYLKELQRSTKVSDKKDLFERLSTRLQKSNETLPMKNDLGLEDSSFIMRPATSSGNLSQRSLEDFGSCISPSLHPPLEHSRSSQGYLSRYKEHVAVGGNSTSSATRAKSHQRGLNATPHRRTLVAKITDNNRICYESL